MIVCDGWNINETVLTKQSRTTNPTLAHSLLLHHHRLLRLLPRT